MFLFWEEGHQSTDKNQALVLFSDGLKQMNANTFGPVKAKNLPSVQHIIGKTNGQAQNIWIGK